jgi:hypothetical protein
VVTATAKFVQLRDSFGELTSHQYYSLALDGLERRDIRQVVVNLDPLRSITRDVHAMLSLLYQLLLFPRLEPVSSMDVLCRLMKEVEVCGSRANRRHSSWHTGRLKH